MVLRESRIEQIREKPLKELMVNDVEGSFTKIDINSIISVSVKEKLVNIITQDDTFTVRQSLQSIEKSLDAGKFIRISRFEIVNIDKVKKFDFTLDGTLRIKMADSRELWASRRTIPEIRRMLKGKE